MFQLGEAGGCVDAVALGRGVELENAVLGFQVESVGIDADRKVEGSGGGGGDVGGAQPLQAESGKAEVRGHRDVRAAVVAARHEIDPRAIAGRRSGDRGRGMEEVELVADRGGDRHRIVVGAAGEAVERRDDRRAHEGQVAEVVRIVHPGGLEAVAYNRQLLAEHLGDQRVLDVGQYLDYPGFHRVDLGLGEAVAGALGADRATACPAPGYGCKLPGHSRLVCELTRRGQTGGQGTVGVGGITRCSARARNHQGQPLRHECGQRWIVGFHGHYRNLIRLARSGVRHHRGLPLLELVDGGRRKDNPGTRAKDDCQHQKLQYGCFTLRHKCFSNMGSFRIAPSSVNPKSMIPTPFLPTKYARQAALDGRKSRP